MARCTSTWNMVAADLHRGGVRDEMRRLDRVAGLRLSRGGLFFASLFLGSLLGICLPGCWRSRRAGGGRSAECRAGRHGGARRRVVGGPMTMAMLVLEATHDVPLAAASLAAVLVARRSCARRSAIPSRPGGCICVARRSRARAMSADADADRGADDAPRRAGDAGGYQRCRVPAGVFRSGRPVASYWPMPTIATPGSSDRARLWRGGGGRCGDRQSRDPSRPRLAARRDIKAVMAAFDAAGADELAVVARSAGARHPLRTYVRRRYAEELDKAQRELFGED